MPLLREVLHSDDLYCVRWNGVGFVRRGSVSTRGGLSLHRRSATWSLRKPAFSSAIPGRMLFSTMRNWRLTSMKGPCRVTRNGTRFLRDRSAQGSHSCNSCTVLVFSHGERRQSVGLVAPPLRKRIPYYASWLTPESPTACAGHHRSPASRYRRPLTGFALVSEPRRLI